MDMGSSNKDKAAIDIQKSYFDVLGICCTSEIPLVEKILKPLDGIKEVSVIVPSRTVIVVHDTLLISQIQIVKALNQARLEANIRGYGEEKSGRKWPSPYTMGCFILLCLSFFKSLFHPLHWLALGAVLVGLPPIVMRSVAAIRRLTLDTNILVLLAVGGAIGLGDYGEAGFIVFLFTFAEWLESRASHKANASMSGLMNMTPQTAVLAETGLVLDAKDVKLNTVIAVKAGEVIPIDGIVVEGNCEVDEKTLTGESFPVAKQIQSNVWAGSINLNGYISVKTTALAENCVVAKMAKLVEDAQKNKSKTQRMIDSCAKYYTPVVILASIGIVVVPTALRVHNLKHWIYLGLVILVSACPCALILSTPVAIYYAFTKAASSGLLFKGGDFLETLAKIKVIAFDKTGTITRGEFVVTDFQSICHDVSLNSLLYWVSSIESKSSHPMAEALVDYARSHSIEPKPENVTAFQNFPGEGIYGQIDGKDIFVGNRKIAMRAECRTVDTEEGDSKGATIGYICLGTTLVGSFSLTDACRSGAAEAINQLKSLGIKTAMLTGDTYVAATHAQDQLGHAIEVVHAELLPEDKVRIIKGLKEEGATAMIGDGVNDAPALAVADIGISMGISGSALATETGHVILMSNDMRKIPQAIRLARKTQRKIVENIALSIITKVAILALAFAGHPLLWGAIVADVGTCLLVIFNSMLVLRVKSASSSTSSSSCGKHAQKHHHHHGSCENHQHEHLCSHPSSSSAPVHHHKECCSHEVAENLCESQKDQSCASSSHPCKSLQPVGSSCKEGSCRDLIERQKGHGDCREVAVAQDGDSHMICIHQNATEVKICGNHSSNGDKLGVTSCSTAVSCRSKPNHGLSCSEAGHQHVKDASHSHSSPIACRDNDHHHHHHTDKSDVQAADHSHDGEHSVRCKTHSCHSDSICRSAKDIMPVAEGHGNWAAHHACLSLEKREMGACCKSFRKECGGHHHGCLGAGLGGLSEIVTE
ncbi:PREDICTED: putative inactive cadmium/zinc-transporting ATPase HMA3 [Nelumbo nucifera]|uniref:Inactive cadmium/zinc-transporting ATPase HMA3 n=2 Tax=Nelumbo nucifera TaxID=4432 RepID=A0A1U8B7Y8_NELNU|nr:PREDICTED: putative inactive cadmium/zinc-transporting ATPase HMA3 [Nelumbo nucifera]DAD46046.1 TPA_asm: hypothetical protein HUJ06_004276 [Nelumbo nucifera]